MKKPYENPLVQKLTWVTKIKISVPSMDYFPLSYQSGRPWRHENIISCCCFSSSPIITYSRAMLLERPYSWVAGQRNEAGTDKETFMLTHFAQCWKVLYRLLGKKRHHCFRSQFWTLHASLLTCEASCALTHQGKNRKTLQHLFLTFLMLQSFITVSYVVVNT